MKVIIFLLVLEVISIEVVKAISETLQHDLKDNKIGAKINIDSKSVGVDNSMNKANKHTSHPSLNGGKCIGPNCKTNGNKQVELMKSGSNFLIVKHFCLNNCYCWPLWVFSIVYLFCNCIVFFAFINTSANLFINGILNKEFYKSGGTLLIVFSLIVSGVGAVIGAHYTLCTPLVLSLFGGLLNLGASVILVGKRGGSLGFISGGLTGLIISYSLTEDLFFVILTTALSFVVGMALGLTPFCKKLKMNIKYMEQCERMDYYSKYGSKESFNSDISSRSHLLRSKTTRR